MKKYLNLFFAVLIIGAFAYGIGQKEQLIAEGDLVYLRLAPVDPRSIMQGDYMRLRYEIERSADKSVKYPSTGYARFELDDKNVVKTASYLPDESELKDNEILFKFNGNGSRINIQPDSFLFQQGLRELYSAAEYGIFRVRDNEHLLVGLADGDLNEIKPPKPDATNN